MTGEDRKERPFALTARIARGGMAMVHVGTHEGRRVAIKLLHRHLAEDPHIQRMFLHEARLASRLDHENVVRVLHHGADPELGAFTVMQYVEGGDLSALLRGSIQQGRRLHPRVVSRIVVDLCRGLHAAHELRSEDGAPLNLIHRDVSPNNVLVGVDGVARLTDFGIAKSDERYTATRPGQLKGKLAYMAPEQLAREDLDRRVDVFAAGVVLWEALCGRRLFKGDNEAVIIDKVTAAEVDPPSSRFCELAPFDPVLAGALARDRDARFASAAALADAVEAAAKSFGGLASRASVGESVRELLAEQLSERARRVEGDAATPSTPWMHDMPSAPGNEETTLLAAPEPAPRLGWLIAAAVMVFALAVGATVWLHHAAERMP